MKKNGSGERVTSIIEAIFRLEEEKAAIDEALSILQKRLAIAKHSLSEREFLILEKSQGR